MDRTTAIIDHQQGCRSSIRAILTKFGWAEQSIDQKFFEEKSDSHF